ncbi:MAG: alkaline phosphatase D [Limisphaerales bacterium]|jgi:alkaline phosphatase D
MIHRTKKETMIPRLLIALLFLPLTALHAAPEGFAGPLVGAIEPDRVTMWMFAPAESQCIYTYRSDNPASPKGSSGQIAAVPNPIADVPGRPFKSAIEGLSPNTRYHYKVTVNGKTDPAWAGSFKTAPAAGNPTTFRLALTSCMKIGKPQTSWPLLLKQQPDIHLTVGDTHYADTTDPTVQLKHHLAYRRQAEFATVIRNIPTYAIWDDHDYGPNNSDGTAKGKQHSLAGWKQNWANPALGTPDTPGAFFKFSRGDVDFFMVDSRYHRSPDKAPDDDQKRMLGDAQFAWLLDGLRKSQARFKIIVSGSTLHHSEVDGWRIYTFSRHRLFDALKEHRISGVMYMSGDIHQSLVWEHPESDRVGYPLVEVISSGVANSKTLSFATVDFDTTRKDPTARVRIVYGDGTVRTDKTWKLSQLSPKHQIQQDGAGQSPPRVESK